MKKLLNILLFFFVFQNVQAQVVFCPPGAEWHYTFFYHEGPPAPGYSNRQIRYLRDSVVGSEITKVLGHDYYYKDCNFTTNVITLLKQKGDTIFIKNITTQNTWQILYNFAALAGQSWTTSINRHNNPSLIVTYTTTVDSVKYFTENSLVLRRLHTTYRAPDNSIPYKIIISERFGANTYLFYYLNPASRTNSCQEFMQWVSEFLCYKDNTFGTKQFTTYACDYQSLVGLNQNNFQSNANIKIFPNPSSDFFGISFDDESMTGQITVTIKDLCGREIKSTTIEQSYPESVKVDISLVAAGVYVLNISNNGALVYTGKLIKGE